VLFSGVKLEVGESVDDTHELSRASTAVGRWRGDGFIAEVMKAVHSALSESSLGKGLPAIT
jgi:hypothetical protein